MTLESSLTKPEPPAEFHPYDHSFGSAGNPQFVAVDASGGPSNGDIYVADNSSNVVRKYNPAGNLITGWGSGGVLDGSTTAVGAVRGRLRSSPLEPTEDFMSARTRKLERCRRACSSSIQDGTFNSEHAPQRRHSSKSEYRLTTKAMSSTSGTTTRSMRFNGTTSTEISNGASPKSGIAVNPSTGDLYAGLGGESIAKYSFDDLGRVSRGRPTLSQLMRTNGHIWGGRGHEWDRDGHRPVDWRSIRR